MSGHGRAIAATVAAALILLAVVAGLSVYSASRTIGAAGPGPASTAGDTSEAPRRIVEASWHRSGSTPPIILAAEPAEPIDGDSAVFVLDGGARAEVRFIGIDSPELTGKVTDLYGTMPRDHAWSMLLSVPKVYLEVGTRQRDKYGRLLAYVWLQEPKTEPRAEDVRLWQLNARMLLDGYAKLMPASADFADPNSGYFPLFDVYCQEAQTAGRGMWNQRFAKATGGNQNTGFFAVPPTRNDTSPVQ